MFLYYTSSRGVLYNYLTFVFNHFSIHHARIKNVFSEGIQLKPRSYAQYTPLHPGANIHPGCKFAPGVYFGHVNGAL